MRPRIAFICRIRRCPTVSQTEARKKHLHFTICRCIRLLSWAENFRIDLMRRPLAAGHPPARQDG
jgi:hypothetical protein